MVISFSLIIVLLVLSAFFSASETAILNISAAKIHKLESDGNKRAKLLLVLRQHKERLIGALLLGNNFVNIAASAVATDLCIDIIGNNSTALLVATVGMTCLILILSEVLPKTYAVRHSEFVGLSLAPIINVAMKLFAPIVITVKYIVDGMLNVLDFKTANISVNALDTIKSTIEIHHKEGEVVSDYKYMLGAVIDLDKINVEEVMVHRNDFYSININLPPYDVLRQVVQSPNSRIPLWSEQSDNIIGLLHVKDLNKLLLVGKPMEDVTKEEILGLAREPWFIPNTTNLKAQLLAFKQQHSLLAFVVNEYGELEGLITLEDIVEEVVGQIEDEYDVAQHNIFKTHGGRSVIVTGNTSIRDLNRELEWDIGDEDASTVGGLILHLARGVPEVGQDFSHKYYRFRVLKKKRNKVIKAKIWVDMREKEAV